MSPDGSYWANKKSLEGIAFRYKRNIYPVEQFDLYYNKPAKVLRKLPYADPLLAKALEQASQKRMERSRTKGKDISELSFPNALITNRDRIASLTKENFVNLSFECTDFQDSIQSIQVSVNGVPLFEKEGKPIPVVALHKGHLQIPLSYGKNSIKPWCFNSQGHQSLKESVEINYVSPPTKPDLYIGMIAVSDYSNDDYDLKYPVKDAVDLIREMGQDTSRFENIYVKTLFDQRATSTNLDSLTTFYANSQVNDHVLLFISGHGLLDDDLEFYFATYDMDFDEPAKKGISYYEIEALLEGAPARKRLLLMDACHSGEVDKSIASGPASITTPSPIVSGYQARGGRVRKSQSQMGLQNSFNLMRELFANVGSTNGIQVISAASGDSYALESDKWKNGIFTYSILKGIREKTADQDQNGSIYVSELRDYVIEEVYRQTNGKQRPTVRSENIEFDFRVR